MPQGSPLAENVHQDILALNQHAKPRHAVASAHRALTARQEGVQPQLHSFPAESTQLHQMGSVRSPAICAHEDRFVWVGQRLHVVLQLLLQTEAQYSANSTLCALLEKRLGQW
jgi:hypothetical protein